MPAYVTGMNVVKSMSALTTTQHAVRSVTHARLKMPRGDLARGDCSLDVLLEKNAGSLWEQHLQTAADPMLTVLHASHISADKLPARSLTRSMRVTKAMREEDLCASPIAKMAVGVIAALLNETRLPDRCVSAPRGSVALWLERGFVPTGVLRRQASQRAAGPRHRGLALSLRSAFEKRQRWIAVPLCEHALRLLLRAGCSSREVLRGAAPSRCGAAQQDGAFSSPTGFFFCG
jgi:hypothetical protein